jgi:hypothetical protein
MEAIANFFGSINFEVIAQLTMVGMIIVSGPIIVFLLAARGGDL